MSRRSDQERLLRAAGVEDEIWLTAVTQHHEKPEGKGYPARLTEVVDAARLLQHVDVFMAKISPRIGRLPLTTQMAARQMFHEDQGA